MKRFKSVAIFFILLLFLCIPVYATYDYDVDTNTLSVSGALSNLTTSAKYVARYAYESTVSVCNTCLLGVISHQFNPTPVYESPISDKSLSVGGALFLKQSDISCWGDSLATKSVEVGEATNMRVTIVTEACTHCGRTQDVRRVRWSVTSKTLTADVPVYNHQSSTILNNCTTTSYTLKSTEQVTIDGGTYTGSPAVSGRCSI